MNNWFECKIKYCKPDSKGKSSKVSETYLVDAMTFSEAEDRVTREVTPFISGDFNILGMKKASVNEIFPNEEGDRWYRCKVYFIVIDEVKATEKRCASTILVFGADIDNAWQHLTEALKDSVSDYEVVSVTETPIVDIFPFSEQETPIVHRQQREEAQASISAGSEAQAQDDSRSQTEAEEEAAADSASSAE